MIESVPEARWLFTKFKNLLDREFRSEEEAARVDQECKTVVEQLSEMEFKIMTSERSELKHSTANEKVIMWVEIRFRLLLLHASQTTTVNPIEIAFATAKIFDPRLYGEETSEVKITVNDQQFLKSVGLKIEETLEDPRSGEE